MKIGKLEKMINEAFDELLIPPQTLSQLVEYVNYKLSQLMVK